MDRRFLVMDTEASISTDIHYPWIGQRRRISLPVRGASYELLIPFRGYSAELKRERNQRSLSRRPHAGAERAVWNFRDDNTSTPLSFRHARRRQGSTTTIYSNDRNLYGVNTLGQ